MRRYLAAVAAAGILFGACGGGATVQPTPTATSSVAPTAVPPRTPPPASHMLKACGLWSRPSRFPWAVGVRPNSPPHQTSVSSSRPRRFRSWIRAAVGWSRMGQCRSMSALSVLWASQFSSPSTCDAHAPQYSCTNRTPRSSNLRANTQL